MSSVEPSVIKTILTQRTSRISEGFEVGRLLPFRGKRSVGPFVFFDHMGPVTLQPGEAVKLDVLAHPHTGLATVTYLFEGAFTHKDSTGTTQDIRPGEVNWMVAGKGITHSERLPEINEQGGTLHGLQTWVALPVELEDSEPAFAHYEGDEQLPRWQEQGVSYRLLAGTYAGKTSAVQTQSPLFYIHIGMEIGTQEQVRAHYSERAVYVVEGQIRIDGELIEQGQMAVLTSSAELSNEVTIEALQASELVLVGGEPLGERFIDWNFVSHDPQKLEAARQAWIDDKMPLPPGETESIPYPPALLNARIKR